METTVVDRVRCTTFLVTSEATREEKAESTPPVEVNLRGHALAPNLAVLRRWMTEMSARGALVELVTAILGHPSADVRGERGADRAARPYLSQAPAQRVASSLADRASAHVRAGGERLRRPPAAPEIDLEGRPTCARACSKVRRPRRGYRRGGSGRARGEDAEAARTPEVPQEMPRREDRICVAEWQWCCPKCGGRTRSLGTKVSEKLDIEAALYFIRRTMRATVACIDCREYMCTADRRDEVVDRGSSAMISSPRPRRSLRRRGSLGAHSVRVFLLR